MDASDPGVQRAIWDSLRPTHSSLAASGSRHLENVTFERSSSDVSFGRVDSLRRSGISPAAARCAHTPITHIRMHRTGSAGRSLSSRKKEAMKTQEDGDMKEIVQQEILLSSGGSQTITFEDVAGLDVAKKLLMEAVTLPLLMPDFFTGIREPWKGVLLFGPPGTGKTLLAKALAATGSVQFYNCPSSALTSKYRGDSEKLVRTVFSLARKSAPSIVFLDEADALMSKRGTSEEHEASRRFKSEVLQEMDGVASSSAHVMVLATSNCPWDIDEAILRRFEKRIYVPLPDRTARKAALQLHLQGVECAEDVDLDSLADALEGYSGADIRVVCKDASLMFMRECLKDKSPEELLELKKSGELNAVVRMNDFQRALNKASPSTRNVDRFEKWAFDYGSA